MRTRRVERATVALILPVVVAAPLRSPSPGGPAAPDTATVPLLVPAPGAPLRAAARGMAAADVNNDGCADLALLRDETLLVYFGGADRRWGGDPDVSQPLGAKGSEIVFADVSGDGKADAVVADHDSYDVAVLLGTGDGRFRAAPGSPFASRTGKHPHTHGLVVADVNGDARPDVVTANNADGDLSVLLGDGRGGFATAPGSPFPCGASPYPFALADVSGDGKLDAVVPNSKPGQKTLTLLLGDGLGRFPAAPNSPLACTATVRWAACGDLNGDRMVDVVASHDDDPPAEGRTLMVLLNRGGGNFAPAPASPLPVGNFAWGVEIVDMDRDGKADLVVGAVDAVRVFLGDGVGNFRPAPGSPFPTGKGAWRVTVADLNADGRPDVATRCVEADRVDIYCGKGR